MEARERGRDAVKAASPNSRVGVTLAINDVQVLPGGESQADAIREEMFHSYLPACQGDDFLGQGVDDGPIRDGIDCNDFTHGRPIARFCRTA